ncbi:MAG: hypothetical protein U5N53_11995 [Mycobacterium sp.]|nr:hypothetical protein [Mycobacterium sp.]
MSKKRIEPLVRALDPSLTLYVGLFEKPVVKLGRARHGELRIRQGRLSSPDRNARRSNLCPLDAYFDENLCPGKRDRVDQHSGARIHHFLRAG